MGIKEVVHRLNESTDVPLLVTEELHQVYAVSGFKRKNLIKLVNEFGLLSYRLWLTYRPGPHPGWDLQKAGRLSSHINAPASIPLRIMPLQDLPDQFPVAPLETAVQLGERFFSAKLDLLQKQIPDDWSSICEYMGRLGVFYSTASSWEWYLCPRSGTTLNFHIEPDCALDPCHFLRAMVDCQRARINSINVYPHTIEIVFHAFTKIERLPYNRRHRVRYTPYGQKV